jgi:hypothetical protein
MSSIESLNEINEYVREYLRYHGMTATLENFDQEIKSKQMPKRLRNDPSLYSQSSEPRLHAMFRPVS